MANSVDLDHTAPVGAVCFWVHTVCFHTLFVSNVGQLLAADDFSRRYFQMHFSWPFRVNPNLELININSSMHYAQFCPILLIHP